MTTLVPRSWYAGPIFGWPVILACFVGMFATIGPLIYAVYGLFVIELEAEFGWSRKDMAFALTIYSLTNAAANPPCGLLIDRFGVRRVLIPSLALAGFLLCATGMLVSELWHLILGLSLISIGGIATNSISFTRTITAWFDRRRGLIIGIASAATGVGVAVFPKLTQQVIAAFDWRAGFIFLGLVFLVFLIPVVSLLMRNDPADVGLKPDGAGAGTGEQTATLPNDEGLTVMEALRTKAFWLLLISIGLATFGLWGLLPHLVPLLVDRGWTVEDAAWATFAFGISMAVSRVVVGYVIDQLFAPAVGAVTFMLSAIGFAMIAYGGIGWPVIVGAVLLGIGIGAEFDLLAYLVGRYFGLRAFATIYALIFIGFLSGTSFGPLALGWTFELTGSYDAFLPVLIAFSVIAAILFMALGPYDQYRARFTGATTEPAAAPAAE